MLNLKESLFIGAIGVSSLFSTGCQIKGVQEILPDPGHEVEVPTITFAENIRVENCVIIHDDPNAVLEITTSEHPIFIAADNNLNQAQDYLLREVVVTGKVTDVYASINKLNIDIGADEERIRIRLDESFNEAEMNSWINTEHSFSGRVIIVDDNSITIDSALKVEDN